MKRIKRKPDIETESMRMWVSDDEKEDVKRELEEENHIKIKKGDYTFNLYGFTKCSKKGELIFIYKFKHEEKVVMYHIFKENEEVKEIIEYIKFIANSIGYSVISFDEIMNNILSQQGSIEKMAEMKKNKALGSSTTNDNSEDKDKSRGKNGSI